MRRRRLLGFFVGAAAWRPADVKAQQAVRARRLGYLDGGSATDRRPLFDAFRQRLSELGYQENQVSYDTRFAEGHAERLPTLVGELLAANPDALLVATTAANLAAKTATATVPIVMIAGADPVGAGLVDSLAHPGGNLTGVTNVATDLTGKRLELIKEIVPSVGRVAVLLQKGDANTSAQLQNARAAAQRLHIELQPILDINHAEDLDRDFATAVRAGAGAAIRMVDPLSITLARETADLAAKHRLPVIYPWRQNVAAGGLIAYGTSLVGQYLQAATIMDKILRGAKPADLPVQQPTKFELVINLKTAKALGLAVPQSLLARADEVIE